MGTNPMIVHRPQGNTLSFLNFGNQLNQISITCFILNGSGILKMLPDYMRIVVNALNERFPLPRSG